MSSEASSAIQIEFDDNSILSSLFGTADSNIHLLEKLNNVSINYRGNIVKIVGNKNAVEETVLALQNLFEDAKRGYEIDDEKIKDTKSFLTLEISNKSQSDLFIQTKKRKIVARSQNQKKYFHLLKTFQFLGDNIWFYYILYNCYFIFK